MTSKVKSNAKSVNLEILITRALSIRRENEDKVNSSTYSSVKTAGEFGDYRDLDQETEVKVNKI
jgi:hypothetical protein